MKTIFISGIIAMVCVLSGTRSVNAVAIIDGAGEILFADDFTSGIIPAASPYSWEAQTADPNNLVSDSDPDAKTGWSCLERPSQCWNVQVTSAAASADDPGPSSGSNYLRLYRPDAADAAAMTAFDVTDSNSVHMELMVYVDCEEDNGAMIYLSGSSANGGWDDARVALSTNWISGTAGKLDYHTGSSWADTGVEYAVGQWQKYEIDYYVDTGEFVLTVGGGSSGTLPARAAGPVEFLNVRTGAEGGRFYIDATEPQDCGDAFIAYAPGDITGADGRRDCVVNESDLTALAGHWLESTAPAE